MATIRTAIQLYDRMTPVLGNITNAMNTMLNTFQAVQTTSENAISAASWDTTAQQIYNASAAVIQYQEELDRLQRRPVQRPILQSSTDDTSSAWHRIIQPVQLSADERFVQEYESVNMMMQQIYESQQNITTQANRMNIIPPGMLNDVTMVQNRIQELANHVQEISNIPVDLRTDEMNQALEVLEGHLGEAVDIQGELTETMAAMDISAANTAYQELNDIINQAGEEIRQNIISQEEFNERIRRGQEEANGLGKICGNISGVLAGIGVAVGVAGIFDLADQYKQAENALQAQTNLRGDSLETANESIRNLYTDNLGESPEAIANYIATVQQMTGRSGAGLEEMTRAGILLSDTFGYDIADSIRSAQMMERQFGISSAEAMDLMIQATQVGLDKNGDLLDTINEYSVHFRKIGLDATDMFNMFENGAAAGTFSVDKLGDAIKEFSIRAINESDTTQEAFKMIGVDANKMAVAFASGGDAAKTAFEQTIAAIQAVEDPVKRNTVGVSLFGTMWEDLGESGIMALLNIGGAIELTTDNLEELNRVRYDDATSALTSLGRTINTMLAEPMGSAVNMVTKYVTDFTTGLQGKFGEIQGIFGVIGYGIGTVGRAVADNWSIVEPIIWGVVAALIVYNATQGIAWLTTMQNVGAKIATAAASAKAAVATFAQTVAQRGLNAALAACPISWIIIGIIAIIAIFYAVIAIINKTAGTTYSATGIICGAIATAGAVIGNILFGVLEIALGIIEYMINGWISFANFFANVFRDPIGSVIHLFADMGDQVLGIIEKIAKAIDFVVGSNLANTVAGWREGLAGIADAAAQKYGNGQYEAVIEKFDSEKIMADMGIELKRFEYGNAYKKGRDFGAGAEDKIKNVFDNLKDKSPIEDVKNTWDGIHENTNDTAKNTAATADALDITDEELKSMRDMAEREIINRFTTAELTVNMGGITNQVNSNMDLDGIGRYLEKAIFETLEVAAEGEY